MDKIINILVLVIIFVFDPLAVALVVAANFAYNPAFPGTRENLYGEQVTIKKKPKNNLNISEKELHEELFSRPDNDLGASLEEQAKYTNWEEEYTDEDEKRMDIIGQNGNDGEHYDNLDYDLNKDGIVDNSDLNIAKNKVKDLKDSIAGVTKSSNRVDKAIKEIKKLEEFISGEDDEYTKTY